MSSAPLVSVVIPCYDAEKWISEAVDSCLDQTYRPIEIIVIDDGSTDKSKIILQKYGAKIKLVCGSNQGGNYARNLGFSLSRGDYIQFLDADDYLLPEKIAHQVHFLQETKADVVYGDWQHQYHEPDDRVWQDDIHISGSQDDVLTSLLRNWWVSPAALLFRREAVLASGGWDESLQAGQDRDFFIQVALTGANIRYQPGCYSIYRRYGATTVSTGNRARWLQNHERLLDKVQGQLSERNQLTEARKQALALSYFSLARNYYGSSERAKQRELYAQVLTLDPWFTPQESRLYTTTYRLFGFDAAERLANLLRKQRQRGG